MLIEKPHQLRDPEIEAEIYYLTKVEGGRSAAIHSGYRGQLFYDGAHWDANQIFVGKDICPPGESVTVNIRTASPQFHLGKLFIGKEFEIREGPLTIGKGKITKIFRTDFLLKE